MFGKAKAEKKPAKLNYSGKTILMTIPSIIIDFLFIGFNGLLAFWFSSPWYAIMCAYYLILTIMRISVLLRFGVTSLISKDKAASELKTYRSIHKMFIVMDLILGGAILLLISNSVTKDYPGFIIYIVAIYTVYKVGLSFVNLFKAGRSKSLTAIILRKIGNIDAMVSLLILENALVNRFGEPNNDYYKQMSLTFGAVIFCLIFIMAIGGLINAKRLARAGR